MAGSCKILKNFALALSFSKSENGGAGAEENRNVRNDNLTNNCMIKTLKTLAIATLITGATVTASNAQTPPYAVHNVSVQWTLTYPDTSATNAKTGTITDTYTTSSVNTAKLIQYLGAAMGVTFKPTATLVAISELSPGSNGTELSNVVTTVYTYETNGGTNIITVTNVAPPTNAIDITTNVSTNSIAGVTNAIIVATNTSYYVSSGSTLTLISNSYLWGSALFSNTNKSFYNLAQDYTNSVFKGTIKTNLTITGTLMSDGKLHLAANGPGTIGKTAGPVLKFKGEGEDTAVTATVGKGKTAMPYSTFNYTWTGFGKGSVGGTYTVGAITTNITGPSTNLSTNYSTNFFVTNGTSVEVSGVVKHSFAKIVQ
jgi:hypothetical protein